MWWRWGESNPSIKTSKYGGFVLYYLSRGPTRGPKNKTVYVN